MIDEIKTETQTSMAKSVESLRHNLTRLRTGRASTSILEHLKVSYYGADMPLSQVASVSVADSRTLTIIPWEKAKHVSGEGENAKVAIRNVRRDAISQIKELEKDKSISEDDQRRGDDEIQKLTDRFVKEVDVVVKNKEDELMSM